MNSNTEAEEKKFSFSIMNTLHLKEGFTIEKKTLYWICQFGGWILYGVYHLLLLYGERTLTIQSITDLLFTIGFLIILCHLYRNFIVKKGWLKILFGKLLFRIIIASFVLSLIFLPLGMISSLIFNTSQLLRQLSLESIISSIIGGAFLFFCWSVCYFLYHYVHNYNRSLKWEALINEFELNKLRSQLNPHFIFNALNSVRVLVDENPDKAKESIDQLSNILRNSLLMDKKKVITLREEIDIVKDYLALESTRFEERLQVHFNIDENSLNHKVPPLMLQTIVENGIKHGIAKLKNGGKIEISTAVQDETLNFQIRNSGRYEPKNQQKTGYGIKSTLQRLELLYHKKAKFRILNETDKNVLTEITIPRWNGDPVHLYYGK